MMDMSQSFENDYLGTRQPLVHFECQPQGSKDIGIPNCEEGPGCYHVKAVERIMRNAGITLGLKCIYWHIVCLSLPLILHHLIKILFVIRGGGNPQLKKLGKIGRRGKFSHLLKLFKNILSIPVRPRPGADKNQTANFFRVKERQFLSDGTTH